MKSFRPKKKLGQHFLQDKNIASKIVDLAELTENEEVWEIGPGKGILTESLVLQKGRLTCFEIDNDLSSKLIGKFGTSIDLINQDILKIDWAKYLRDKQVKLVANLPYQITSPFLFKVTEFSGSFSRIVIMIQKEVADRITAQPGTKDYGKLTLKMQFNFRIKYGFTVKPHLFYPVPKVDSAVVILTPRPDKPHLEDEALFWKVVGFAFQNRRKMLRRNLRMLLCKEKLQELGSISRIELTRRGETLTEKDFIELYEDILSLRNN
ncbi:MAG: 16S rRNA (adenine(1518)-N(6)/adenine(1519)-N(6))-dimethyltransferase RsmA [Candidatus Cloacimonetes bacterium]|nr:16S rRNA (adenine(1518)-N(6)/adenine(1519)-N(6))-dimethyltransferase RsmA [Candidatus Cloacimonadota bacterium]